MSPPPPLPTVGGAAAGAVGIAGGASRCCCGCAPPIPSGAATTGAGHDGGAVDGVASSASSNPPSFSRFFKSLKKLVVSEAPRRRSLRLAPPSCGSLSVVTDALIASFRTGGGLTQASARTSVAVGRVFGSTVSIVATRLAAAGPRASGTGELGTPRWMRRTRAQMSSASNGRAEASSAYRITPHDQTSDFEASYPSGAAPAVISSGAA
mmetsp:Transcript_20466/g.41619  ORF Transcript_20466/g.41619 Transcript_20466/m.41619 type:complete len:209 (-) Transcript_20466:809-1435(-)